MLKFTTKHASFFAVSASIALLMASCQSSTTGKDTSASSTADSLLTEFELRESIKTATASYRVTSTQDKDFTSYITLSANVQWPEELGKFKIENLRDTIMSYTFGHNANGDVNKAITAYVTEVNRYELGDKIERIDSIPESAEVNELYSSNSLSLTECTAQTVTYTASMSEYLGGAHPISASIPFTFILDSDRIVNMDFLFAKGSENTLKPILMDAIAISHSMTPDELNRSLLNEPVIDSSTSVYLLNGAIVFHFNAYEILPYSFGQTDAYITPLEVADILTPEAKKLLTE